MKKERFYVVLKPRSIDTVLCTEFLTHGEPNLAKAPKCPRCGLSYSLMRWLPPYRAELETWERGFSDIAFGSGPSLLVSQRFRALFLASKLRGLSGFDPVEVVKIKRHKKFKGDPPPYFHVQVAYSQARIDIKASGMEWGEGLVPCPECHATRNVKRWQRLLIEPGTWSGEDVFIARGLNREMCSPAFKEFCDTNDLIGVVFLPSEHYAYDHYPYEKEQRKQSP
ncbi:MAG: hypothetical protein BroJett014_32960 [Planctomycetota bacterium]|nr:hypothetical protein [Planctomycetota bacterium]GIK54323.1 MAG: hypothetical protein BroJett014_32960 [Planctomycetota bacterium]